jgi:hypothetical protein
MLGAGEGLGTTIRGAVSGYEMKGYPVRHGRNMEHAGRRYRLALLRAHAQSYFFASACSEHAEGVANRQARLKPRLNHFVSGGRAVFNPFEGKRLAP